MAEISHDVDALSVRYPALLGVSASITEAASAIIRCLERGGKLLVAGNGGSASDADHIVGELQKSFLFKRPLHKEDSARLTQLFGQDAAALISRLEGGIRAINLGGSPAFMTAFSNDSDYKFAFAQALYVWADPSDIFLGITTSGNSENILQAARVAKLKNIPVIGLTGESGGRLGEYADILINVPTKLTHEVQELHLPIYHALCYIVERHFFSEKYSAIESNLQDSKSSSAPRMGASFSEIPSRIDLLVFDFDGVFTDNRVLTMQDGTEGVFCSRGDGLGIELLRQQKVNMIILSKETNPVVEARARKLKIPCYFGCDDKLKFLQKHISDLGIRREYTAYVGNDVNDLEPMAWVGFSVAPADSHPEVLKIATHTLKNNGGAGAIREFADKFITKSNARHR